MAGRPSRWKWFFAYNGSYSDTYDFHIHLMIRSALANTSLDPHLIYFGPPDDPILSFAEGHGVKIIHHEPSILTDLERIHAKFPHFPLHIATGAYLRIDGPFICSDLGYTDEFVLYTDCDVVFLHDIPEASTESFLRPTLFSCAPQTSQTDWENDLNSGVMVMNVANMRESFPSFKRFITSGDTLNYELFERGQFDQTAYRRFYASQWDKLPLEYNWKPYWGFNEDALIVHFHGPKIPHVRAMINGETIPLLEVWTRLFQLDPDSYLEYLAQFERYESD
jgi:hypothetical protein